MRVKVVDPGKATSRQRQSKYGPLLVAMRSSLDSDGVDGRLRGIVETAAWSPSKQRRYARGLRFYYRAHRVPGMRLSLGACDEHGITFRWLRISAGERAP